MAGERKLALIEKDNPTWRDLAEDSGLEPLLKTPGADAAKAGGA